MEDSQSLSLLLSRVKESLEASLPEQYWVVAEILEIHENRSGHAYLELVEKKPESDHLLARARATIWSSRFGMLRPFFEAATGSPLKSGMKILCRVSVEFHTLYGFSLNITDIDPAYTLGDLARKIQEVILRLRKEGVFEMNRELAFPQVPQRIAVISSERAAGYGDFIHSLQENSYDFDFQIRLFPAQMQGKEAASSIMSALDDIHESIDDFDLVALIRGGGSRADLECFNDYELAYYLTQFPLPVLTGIGHERDESVCDMVAAVQLKTPTALAEFLVDQLLAFEFRLGALREQLEQQLKLGVQKHLAKLEHIHSDLQHLSGSRLGQEKQELTEAAFRMQKSLQLIFSRSKDQLNLLEKRNELVDPRNILQRGYSMTLMEGRILRSASKAKAGKRIETRLFDGRLISQILSGEADGNMAQSKQREQD